jgi:hypothetical protein
LTNFFKVVAQETGLYISHKFVRSKEFDKASPGVIVPGHLEGEARIAWLMENDQAFRRGRLRWEKQQKVHKDNLEKREKNKHKRRESAADKSQSASNNGSNRAISTDGESHSESTRSSGVKFAQEGEQLLTN